MTRLSLHEPFYRVGIDLIGALPKTERGMKYIVAERDHLIRWTEVKALKTKSSSEVAKFIFDDIIWRHGAPSCLVSDQGSEFMAKIIGDICKRVGTMKSFTSAYHPQCNWTAERLNRTLIYKLATGCNCDFSRWDILLSSAVFCYRITPFSKLKRSPFELLYGRRPKILSEVETMNEDVEQEDLEANDIFQSIEILRKEYQDYAIKQRETEIGKDGIENNIDKKLAVGVLYWKGIAL